jgi:hypothetical protein
VPRPILEAVFAQSLAEQPELDSAVFAFLNFRYVQVVLQFFHGSHAHAQEPDGVSAIGKVETSVVLLHKGPAAVMVSDSARAWAGDGQTGDPCSAKRGDDLIKRLPVKEVEQFVPGSVADEFTRHKTETSKRRDVVSLNGIRSTENGVRFPLRSTPTLSVAITEHFGPGVA